MSMCFSFILERMIVESREYQEVAEEVYNDESATTSDLEKFCDGVYSVVFQWIYRQLSLNRERGRRNSKATGQLLKALSELRSQFGKFCLWEFGNYLLIFCDTEVESGQTTQPDGPIRYPSQLISALLGLVASD